jgi:SynChlorMet cassette protein ScmC
MARKARSPKRPGGPAGPGRTERLLRPGPPAPAYRMKVGPLSWRVVPGPGFEDWGARFARILELVPVGPAAPVRAGERRLFISGFDMGSPGADPSAFLDTPSARGLPRTGWRLRGLFPVRFWWHPESADLIAEIATGQDHDLVMDSMVKMCFPLQEELILRGGFPLHSALVARDKRGIALAAAGGTGKSTCSRRIPRPWRALCDDTLLLLPGSGDGFEAHPFATWSDYLWKRSERTWDISSHVPLGAVFFLKQAPVDKATPIGQGEAAIYLGRSSNEVFSPFTRRLEASTARSLKARTFDNACRVAKSVPAFILEVSLEGRFWEEIERVLG